MKNRLLSRRFLCVLIIFAVVFGTYAAILAFSGNEYTIYSNYREGYTCEKAEVVFGPDHDRHESSIAETVSVEIKDGYVRAKIRSAVKGSEYAAVSTYSVNSSGDNERNIKTELIKVSVGGLITNNIYDSIYIVLSVLSLLVGAYYLYCFVSTAKSRRFSGDALFFLAVVLFFLLILGVWGSALVYSFAEYHTTSSIAVYDVNRNFMTFLTLGTLPLMLVFVLSLTVSNLVLIKKEGFRPSNMLGIIASFSMLFGIAAIAFIYFQNQKMKSDILNIIYSVISPLYVLFLILLTSSIIYGIYASKYTPAYDKDYIIILGCKIRDDGTLYPLIKGRVDRAVEFYRSQLEKTGKAACFVPSGGQGSDEVMPEGEAMKNYLLEKGIPEEQIVPEMKSATTRENMRFSKEIIDSINPDAKIVFSTTSYHVYRSGSIAYSEGINIDGIGSRTKWYFWPNAFLREVAGIFVNHPKKQLVIIMLIALTAGIGSYIYSLL